MVWDSLGDQWFNYRGYVRRQGAQTLDGTVFGPVIALLAEDESVPYDSLLGIYKYAVMGDHVQSWARHVGFGLTAYNSNGHGNAFTLSRHVHGVTVHDSLPEKYNWRVMRYLARDFVGCMIPGDANYNPEASVNSINELDNPTPCAGGLPIVIKSGGSHGDVQVMGHSIHVTLSENGEYQIFIIDPQGKQFYNRTVKGRINKAVDISRLNKCQYYVYISLSNHSRKVTGVRLD